jgi:SOS-response transcriptional repressor LexA
VTTLRDAALYNVLLERYLQDGVPPTLADLARRSGMAGKASARLAVRRLVRAGWVRLVRRMPVPCDVIRSGPRCPKCESSLRASAASDTLAWRCACSEQ